MKKEQEDLRGSAGALQGTLIYLAERYCIVDQALTTPAEFTIA